MDENNMNEFKENYAEQPYSYDSGQSNVPMMNGEPIENGSNNDCPGKGAAIAGLVLGIVSIVCWFFGAGAVIGLATGIVGIICSTNAKKAGFTGGMQTAGFICSLIGLIGSALAFVACGACAGVLATAGF